MSRRKYIAAAGGVSLLVGLLAGAPAAFATNATDPGPTVVTAQMTTAHPVRVVDDTPDADGNIQVELDNGAVVTAPSAYADLITDRAGDTAGLAGTVSPFTTIWGACGSSHVEMNYKSNGEPVHMDTGFTVTTPAISYTWNVLIEGSSGTGYTYNYHASGGLASRTTWAGQHSSSADYPTGTYSAAVNPAGSYALLNNGDFCYSGGPATAAYLIK